MADTPASQLAARAAQMLPADGPVGPDSASTVAATPAAAAGAAEAVASAAPAAPITPAHAQSETIAFRVDYPAHVQRGAPGHEFEANRRQLITKMGIGCFNPNCRSHDNLEVHHFLIEWSEWEFADPAKVLQLAHHFDIYGFAGQLGDQPVRSPDDIRNLMVLCAECHRGAGEGIHLVPSPNLFAQWLARDGIVILERPTDASARHTHSAPPAAG